MDKKVKIYKGANGVYKNIINHIDDPNFDGLEAVDLIIEKANVGEWADRVVIPAPQFANTKWIDQPENQRKVIIWENFDTELIMQDFYNTMKNYKLQN